MDINGILSKCGNRYFRSEGQMHGQLYMVLDDTIIYIHKQDREQAEGRRIKDMHRLIKSTFSIDNH